MTGLEPNDNRSSPITGNTSKDGSGSEYRLIVDSNGYLVTSVSGAFNSEDDDGGIPAGELRETTNNLLYGYDSGGESWERVLTDGSGKLKVYTP